MSALVARILRCADCESDLTTALRCARCGRSYEPAEDGIISALPSTMQRGALEKDRIQRQIDEAGPGEHGESVVLYEQAFHDEQAPHYDSLFADPLPLRTYYQHLVRDQIFGFVRRQPFVVDLCCGTGKSSAPLLERGLTIVGIDVSREMLRLYRRKCPGTSNPILIHADASRPPLRPQSCGAVSMIGGLHHIPDREGSLQSCCDALSEGGLLILHEPLKTGRKSSAARVLENIYAVTDPARMWSYARRRLGIRPPRESVQQAQQADDFTPYERPFTSVDELHAAMPREMSTVILRSQGILSFHEFAPYLQSKAGKPLASLIVRLDDLLSRSDREFSGDALFGVFRKGVPKAASLREVQSSRVLAHPRQSA